MKKTVFVKKLHEGAVIPAYGTEYSAGADLYAWLPCEHRYIEPGSTSMIGTGIAMEIPEGFVGLVYARSGLSIKNGIAPANKVGVIDSDYRGEIMVALHNGSRTGQTIKHGERVAQIIITPYVKACFEAADELTETDRADGGFGSTGK